MTLNRTKNEFLAEEDIHNIKVSVDTVTYNSQDDILICIDHVLKQSYPIDSIIIVDNASSDCTVDYLRQFLEQRGEQKPPVELIENKVNVGFAPGHNQAIEQTNSDYVLVLNPDVSLEPNYISEIIRCMSSHPEVGSATGILKLKADPSIVDTTGLIMNKAYRAFDRGSGEQASKWSQSGFVFGVSGAAAMYSREMIRNISITGEFFDNDFFAYKEDVDVAWRAQVMGWKAYYVAEAVGLHERGWKKGGRQSVPLFIRKASYINRYKMIYKNERLSSFIKKVPCVLAYEFASNLYFLWKEPKVLQEWGSFYKKRSELKRKRAQIQAVRTRE